MHDSHTVNLSHDCDASAVQQMAPLGRMQEAVTSPRPLKERAEDVIAPVLTHRAGFDVAHAAGSRVWSTEGKELLDFSTGIACLNLGHNHPDLVAAAQKQLESLWHGGWGTYRYESLVDAAEKVVDVTPASVQQVVFMNSGAEAVEAAIKLARRSTGRQGVIAFRGGFHGRTMGSVAYTTSKAEYRKGYHPLVPSVFVSLFPHPHSWRMSQAEADELALDHLRRMLKHEVTSGEVAAFLVEPVQGEGGYYPASSAFLSELRTIATEAGILLVLDEVQTGFGRTGDWFACQVLGVDPDILVMGKAIANGLPLSGIGSSKERFAEWKPGSHGSTFGGNPISCAAAAANIDTLRGVLPGVQERSELSFERFKAIASENAAVGDVRGLGLMIGIDLVDHNGKPNPAAFEHVYSEAEANGLFILPCGPDGNVIRFIPPLNVSLEDLGSGIDILESAIRSYEQET